MNLQILLLSWDIVKILIFIKFSKKLILVSLFTPRFFLQKFINVAEHFFETEGGNSLKEHMLMGGGICKKKQEGGQNLQTSSKHTF